MQTKDERLHHEHAELLPQPHPLKQTQAQEQSDVVDAPVLAAAGATPSASTTAKLATTNAHIFVHVRLVPFRSMTLLLFSTPGGQLPCPVLADLGARTQCPFSSNSLGTTFEAGVSLFPN